ncbi:hypothetical protein CASFOL_015949 [Castilleja foliolosa]|uniref:Uncharacterized protein n=1 Tax=Castilleja foliolosa TaxID=1961234 RepID=A0ABD3DH86_9LAMI
MNWSFTSAGFCSAAIQPSLYPPPPLLFPYPPSMYS